jgi:hypothetical protein
VKRSIMVIPGIVAMAVMGLTTTASATSADGSWWSGVKACGVAGNIQVHYRNFHDSTGALYTRADGYNVVNAIGSLRSIYTKEYHAHNGSQVGPGRQLTFTGTAHSSSATGFAESFLPYILTNPSDGAVGQVAVGTTSGSGACEVNIGQG